MAVLTKWRMFVVFVFLNLYNVQSSQDIIKSMASSFGKLVTECQTELQLGNEIIQEFVSYWREDYQLVNRDMGCMILCMASRMDLIEFGDMTLHHGNAHEFAKSHGADDATAAQIVTIIHDCEKASMDEGDLCTRVMKVAKCFKVKMHDLKWAPSIEIILEEVMISV
ncbi:hypothetical protein K1T71_010528 [Dendrolimus kikuchii]|uniref:Uncharacterized protein n=1 Tax=Dendrolimus kikuchii TaxID=765133 RepID=A0ACC1CSX4_9NEOP|nr:hypothetical protein K1T71_010528 [Dendrolimus kikuchii]